MSARARRGPSRPRGSPRRTTRRRSSPGKVALAVIGCLIAMGFGALAGGAHVSARLLQDQVRSARQALKELDGKHRELEQERARLETERGMEMEARRAGFVRPGEVLLQIPR
ncbi:MAG TPA: hypothetical protein VLH79_13880 [Chthonomonadales bacterium]|nr:hypothetical protein [Chthonomonadales bacterium]